MPDDDDIDPEDGFEPDERDEWINPYEEARRWANGNDLYLPDDFVMPLGDFGRPEDIRGEPFGSMNDALEWLFNTGAFVVGTILYDDLGFFFVAVGESP